VINNIFAAGLRLWTAKPAVLFFYLKEIYNEIYYY